MKYPVNLINVLVSKEDKENLVDNYQEVLEEIISKLGASQPKIILGYYKEGKTLEEIGEEVSLCSKTVSDLRLKGIRNMLRYVPMLFKDGTADCFKYLSLRARNVLSKNNIKTMEDLTGKTAKEIESLKDCGHATVEEIKEFVSAQGLSLSKGENKEYPMNLINVLVFGEGKEHLVEDYEEVLESMLYQIPRDAYEIIVSYYKDGKTIKAISEEIFYSPQTVSKIRREGEQELREQVSLLLKDGKASSKDCFDFLPVRARNLLCKYNILTLEALTTYTPSELESLRGFGSGVVKEIEEFLKVRGLSLEREPVEPNIKKLATKLRYSIREFLTVNDPYQKLNTGKLCALLFDVMKGKSVEEADKIIEDAVVSKTSLLDFLSHMLKGQEPTTLFLPNPTPLLVELVPEAMIPQLKYHAEVCLERFMLRLFDEVSRDAIVRHYNDGVSCKEIAKDLKLKESDVKVFLENALETLKHFGFSYLLQSAYPVGPYDTDLLRLGLGSRAFNAIEESIGLVSVERLSSFTKKELLEMNGLGVEGVKRVETILADLGYELHE